MGLLLLALRVGTFESGLFKRTQEADVQRGSLKMLFLDRTRALRYLACILIGVPIWYVIGALVALSQDVFVPEFGIDTSALDADGLKNINGTAIRYCYIGLSIGDLLSGLLSQWQRSRKKVIVVYLALNLVLTLIFLFGLHGVSINTYNWICLLLGMATGYWVIFATVASEQFGTNLRGTVAITAPNFVRGSVWPITTIIGLLGGMMGNVWSALVVGLACIGGAFWAVLRTSETFSTDMDFVER